MYRYAITMKHDRGVVTIQTTASSRDAAVAAVLAAERAPERAIRKIVEFAIPFREHGVWQARGFDKNGAHFNRAFRRKVDVEAFINRMARKPEGVEHY
ncbi:hypothetical protein [Cupriavidus necator]